MKKEDVLKLVAELKCGEIKTISHSLEDANIVIETAISENLKNTPETGLVIIPRISKEGVFVECLKASV